jgi:hypothetical protein
VDGAGPASGGEAVAAGPESGGVEQERKKGESIELERRPM